MAVITSVSKFSERHFKIRKFIFMVFALMFSFNITFSQTADTTLTKLFQNSYKVIDAMRLPGGFYLDALALGGAGAKPAALNANGVGLISLCIADSMYKNR